MRKFVFIWVGQFFSLLGTSMSQFALAIWAWQITGQATALALVALFNFAPSIIVGPIAGALVDRWNRKLVLILSDTASAIGTITILILILFGRLEIWHLYIIGIFTGTFQSFSFPAYSSTISMVLSKEQYSRASGLLSLADSISNIFSPILAGFLIGSIGVIGILTIDIVTFLLAVGMLLSISLPQPTKKVQSTTNLFEDSVFGFKYILKRKGLLGLQLSFFISNLLNGLAFTLFTPLILLRAGNDTITLGTIQAAFGVGGVLGGLMLSIWGGPKKKVNGIFLGGAASYMLGVFTLGIGRSNIVWLIGAFFTMFFIPTTNGSSQALWQSKVPYELQGRIFATRAFIAQISSPIAMAIAGPLADNFLLPAMEEGGFLVPYFNWLTGTGPGAGISLLYITISFMGILVCLGGYLFKEIRDVEELIPDHDEVSK
ncbi:MFS transporter [Candidatus Bathyarchaeota archaeon]|nr:MFS transporter [Candidatus Bathyarchaeota archaeon]